MQLIGINGFKHAGKGETGNAVFDAHDGIVYQVGFADKLKIIAARALGFSRPPRDLIALMDSMKETASFSIEYDEPTTGGGGKFLHDLTGRQYLQYLGNDARELFGETFWIDQVLPDPRHAGWISALENRYPGIDCVVITDLRYPNEAKRVLDLGGSVWEVIRPGTESDGHASEQVLDRKLITRQIDNSGSLANLNDRVREALLGC